MPAWIEQLTAVSGWIIAADNPRLHVDYEVKATKLCISSPCIYRPCLHARPNIGRDNAIETGHYLLMTDTFTQQL
jgi:hypothetical protein